MTRLVTIGKRGPAFHEPRSLADTLKASVDYLTEKRRQEERLAGVVDSDSLPSDYTLREIHCELSLAVSRG